MKKYLILLIAVVAFASCEETPEVSRITSLLPFTIDTPDLVITDDSEDKTLTIPITLSETQVVATTITATLDEENTTATNGVDFVFEDTEIEIEGYVRTATLTVDIIGDIDPDGEPEFIVINLGPTEATNAHPFVVASTVQLTIQLNDFNGDEPIITLDWDGLLAVPSITGTTDPVFPVCANGVDLDPFFLYDNNGTLEFVTYSDDYGACPEQFTGLGDYADGTYIMLVENFANPFAPYPDALGDLCIVTTVLQPGVGSIEFEQSLPDGECYIATSLGYAQGGPFDTRDVFEMVKDGTTYMFNSLVDGSEFGTIGRYAIGQSVYDALNQKKLDRPYTQPATLVQN
ncbi:MAG: hypothetical protein KDD32_03900 [Bacteroidetes bacterium]|nr:hypothetical protein [Bacteroidota bacterium]